MYKQIDGIGHECVAESFTQGYQVFVLIVSVKAMTNTTTLLAGGKF